MSGWTQSEWFLYGGIAAMAVAVILLFVCIVGFTITGKRLKKKLEQEYGKQQR